MAQKKETSTATQPVSFTGPSFNNPVSNNTTMGMTSALSAIPPTIPAPIPAIFPPSSNNDEQNLSGIVSSMIKDMENVKDKLAEVDNLKVEISKIGDKLITIGNQLHELSSKK